MILTYSGLELQRFSYCTHIQELLWELEEVRNLAIGKLKSISQLELDKINAQLQSIGYKKLKL